MRLKPKIYKDTPKIRLNSSAVRGEGGGGKDYVRLYPIYLYC